MKWGTFSEDIPIQRFWLKWICSHEGENSANQIPLCFNTAILEVRPELNASALKIIHGLVLSSLSVQMVKWYLQRTYSSYISQLESHVPNNSQIEVGLEWKKEIVSWKVAVQNETPWCFFLYFSQSKLSC